MKAALLGVTLGLMAHSAEAGEVIAAIGGSKMSLDTARDGGVAELSYRFGANHDGFSPQLTFAAFDRGVVFAGAGLADRWTISGAWFVEAAGQIGALSYDAGTELAVRSAIGVGHSFGNGARASLGIARVTSDDAWLTSATLRFHLDL